MKFQKFTALFLLSAMLVLVAGCGGGVPDPGSSAKSGSGSPQSAGDESPSPVSEESEDPAPQDRIRPTIRMNATAKRIHINQSIDFDFLDGVTGTDNIDGIITDKIEVDKGDFDGDTPGEYMITYTLKDQAGNEATPVTRTVIVRDSAIFVPPSVFTESIDGEILNPTPYTPKGGGAWYHKVVSSRDQWIGIEGTITLPEIKITRYDGAHNAELDFDSSGKNLDNPSIYLGGNALSESDVGLSFSKGLIDPVMQTISTGGVAFRPFWRYITSTDKDAGGYDTHDGEYAVSANGNNCHGNYHWQYTEFYYLPGDKLRMIIYIPAPGKMQLQIEVIEKSALASSVEMRERYGWRDPQDFKSPIFSTPGHGTGMGVEYKRVNAIDQAGNEGKPTIATDTEVKNAVWHEVYLYRAIDGVVYRVPMNEARMGVTSAPDETRFSVTYDGVNREIGGEILTIHPGYAN